jgi:hypothetical protein
MAKKNEKTIKIFHSIEEKSTTKQAKIKKHEHEKCNKTCGSVRETHDDETLGSHTAFKTKKLC